MNYKQEVFLLRRGKMTHVDVDHYREVCIRCGTEVMTIDEYEALQVDHENGKHHCDSYTEIINVSNLDTAEYFNAKAWFLKAKKDMVERVSLLAQNALTSIAKHD